MRVSASQAAWPFAPVLMFLSLALMCGCGSGTTIRQSTMSLPWYVTERPPEQEAAAGPMVTGGPQKSAGVRTFETVNLENEYLRVEVAPEIGGAVSRAIFKPTGDDIFFREGKAKDWLPFWESGVKASFPYREHGMATIQPASWRTVRREDGSVTMAMWMEFSRYTESYNAGFYGRYSPMLLSQHVTLHPRRALIEITYRIVNPAPFRQGRQIWNDALLPRNQLADGIVQGGAQPPEPTRSEFIYPARYVSHHGGRDFRTFDETNTPLATYPPPHISIFSWGISYGFAGLWYPDAKVNRLRIFDPQICPGTKLFINGEGVYQPGTLSSHTYNFVELWGGFDNIFEAVEDWIGPGETYQFTHYFTYVKGIGKVDYANTDAAVNVEFGGESPQVEVVTFSRVRRLLVEFDGQPLGAAECAPDKPARFALPHDAAAGRVKIRADGRLIIEQSFPLAIPDDTSRHEKIRTALGHTPEHWELSDLSGEASYRSSIERYPQGTTSRGRVLYRDGQIDAAIACLNSAVESDPDDGEGWHLLGAALLEKGETARAHDAFSRAISAAKPYAPARYFLALEALETKDYSTASAMLATLIKEDPRHFEARLLKAWIDANAPAKAPAFALQAARALDAEDPADPRVAFVLQHCARAAGDESTVHNAAAALKQLLTEPGAPRRLEEFKAATQGRYVAPARLSRQGE